MKTLALLLLSLTVALGVPAPPPGVPQNPVVAEGDLRPLLGDVLPVQGHVVVDDPAPRFRLGSQEEKEKPEAAVEQKGGVWTELKVEPEVKEVKAEAEVKVEPEVKEVKAEAEVKVEPEVKEVKAEAEVKVEPEVKEVKAEPKVKAEAEVKVQPEVNPEAEVKVDQEVDVKEEEIAPELEDSPDFKLESEEKVEPEVMAKLEVNDNPEAEIEPDVQGEPEPEDEPTFNEEQGAQEEYQVQMNLEDEPETEFERHIDMEARYGMMSEPIMELEPEDDDNMFGEELSNTELEQAERSLREPFENEEAVMQPLPEEERFAEEKFLGSEPIMELEPEDDHNMFGGELSNTELEQAQRSLGEPFENEEAIMQPLPEEERFAEEKFLGSEPIMELEPLDEDMFGEEPSNTELAEAEKSLKGAFQSGDPAIQSLPEEEGLEADTEFERHIDMEGKNEMLGDTTMELEDDDNVFGDELSNATRGSYCPGVIYEGKCYLFFRGPKKAADAEFFCQDHFPGGHLASITSQHIHLKLMKLILDQNGSCTRTWVGGLRYLDTDRFIWLDGSHWNYTDWLSGEPNNTSNMEDCLEVLSCGNGKFNDFTCWEPQAFICSYTVKESQM